MPFRVKTAVYCMNYGEETIKMLAKNTVSDVKSRSSLAKNTV